MPMTNETGEDPGSIKNKMKSDLQSFQEVNPKAYEILVSHINDGFFETRQTPRPIKELANKLLDTITEEESANED